MDPQDYVFQLIRVAGSFVFAKDCGSYVAAEFVRNSHDSNGISDNAEAVF